MSLKNQPPVFVPFEFRDGPSRQELIDALHVMVMAWEAQTTVDGRKMIGLTGDITFPAMPREIKSSADARRILEMAVPTEEVRR